MSNLEVRRRLSEHARGRIGPLSANWQGDISFEEYPQDFNEELKERIRTRDSRTCQLCGKSEGQKPDIHHINYDKKVCEEYNLITLCRSCNIKVNGYREKYRAILSEKVCLWLGT